MGVNTYNSGNFRERSAVFSRLKEKVNYASRPNIAASVVSSGLP